MMSNAKVILTTFCVIFATFQQITNAQYGACDHREVIAAVGHSREINHSAGHGQCRYQIIAPVDSFIQVNCSLTLNAQMTCNNRVFYISRSGEKDLRDWISYCNSGTVVSQSIGNEIVVAYQTNMQNSGSFKCTFTAVALTNSNCDCGWNPNFKIVGGSVSGVNEFVSHGGLVDAPTHDVFCGAVIIKQHWAVTAAHCFDAYPNAATTALLVGDHDISVGTDTKWAAAYAVHSHIKHPNYNADKNLNDIALVKTREYIRFNIGVGPACLPYTFNTVSFVGQNLTVVGWGTTSFAGPSSNILKKASLTVISNADCALKMENIDSTKICTDGKKVSDSCGKDSGGGLYYFYNRYYAIGIVNYGLYCASSYPSVNSRFDKYIGFIEAHIGGFFCRK